MSYLEIVAAAEAEAARPRRSVGRIIGITLFSVVAGILVIALILAGVTVWNIQRSFPQLDGEIALSGLDDAVEVQRDELGIPTITATTSHDLFYAQGYVHAQDRFWEMDFRRHVTSGRLSELFGESQLGTDTFLRTLGWRKVAEQELELLSEETRAYYEAYADGVNAYLADHDGAAVSFEYAVLGMQNSEYEIEKWTPADSLAWLKAMAWDLRGNVDAEGERALLAANYTPDEIAQLYPAYPLDEKPVIVPTITTDAPPPTPRSLAQEAADAAAAAGSGTDADGGATDADGASISWVEVDSVVEAVGELLGGVREGVGSNSWVVSGALTESGMPLLVDDPHLGPALPSVWYQVGLRCAEQSPECPFDVGGFSFSGVPGVIIGHNDRVAWGLTNLNTDVADLYIEKVNGEQYWRDGALVDLVTSTETIRVAGGDDVELQIRSTGHGPIISGLSSVESAIAKNPFVGGDGIPTPPADQLEGEYAVSLQWTALQPGTAAESIFALNLARDFGEFRAAATLFDVPAQNLIYADVDGNIGYQTPGRLPVRGAGDGWLPQPGWDSAYDWQGFIPFEELPVVYNPPSGYIVTANNRIVDDSYPYAFGDDWDYGWRAARIEGLLQRKIAAGKLTADDMRDIQADNEFWMGLRLSVAYADVSVSSEGAQQALDLLASWDAQSTPDSSAAAYANVLWDELAMDLFVRGREHPVPLAHGRMFLVVDRLLNDPESPWWTNAELGVDGRDEMLAKAAEQAYDRIVQLQGDNPDRWNWGSLHAIELTHSTFGSSGIGAMEWLFNRGPYAVGGGTSAANATGWSLGTGSFTTDWVPSMRMIVDLGDFDASRWNHLTGASGHTFHPNYTDQAVAWQKVQLTPWAWSRDAVADTTTHTLTLRPRGEGDG